MRARPRRVRVEPTQIAQLRAQVHNLDQVIAQRTENKNRSSSRSRCIKERVQSSPAVEQQYKELTRGYQTALDSYNELQKKRDEAAMAAELQRKQQGEQFRVLDPANLPDKPSFPNRPLFAAGGLGGGLALGLGIAFLLEMQDTSLKTERDVEFALRLPVLAMIPEIEPMPQKMQRARKSLSWPEWEQEPRSERESLRRLCTRNSLDCAKARSTSIRIRAISS